jgi:hypothetical protein
MTCVDNTVIYTSQPAVANRRREAIVVLNALHSCKLVVGVYTMPPHSDGTICIVKQAKLRSAWLAQ